MSDLVAAFERDRAGVEEQLEHAERLKSLGLLAGGIAHDLNNLLMSVLGNASLVRAQLPEGADVHDSIASIELGARRASELANQMLAYAGRSSVALEPVQLRELTGEMAALLRASIPCQIELGLEVAEGLPSVSGSPGRLRQVVLNLMTNAADAIGDQSGRIDLTLRERFVTGPEDVACVLGRPVAAGHYVELAVSDTGAGMDSATRNRIFEPFFSTKGRGRGLGLAAMLGIIRAHHGALEVRSTPGAGSAFVLLLPVAAPSAPALALAEAPAESLTGTILVVDDEPDIRRVVARMVQSLGYGVLTAGDGVEAEQLVRDEPSISAVALDLTMPGRNANETIAALRLARPDLRIVVMSGYAECRLPSGDGISFLQKPFTAPELGSSLARS
jgi:nitrogen-specific signal transduction histidine kinase/CheY-like chemotaxis protein